MADGSLQTEQDGWVVAQFVHVDSACAGVVLASLGQDFFISGDIVTTQFRQRGAFAYSLATGCLLCGEADVPALPLRVGSARSPCRLFKVQGLRADLYVIVHCHRDFGIMGISDNLRNEGDVFRGTLYLLPELRRSYSRAWWRHLPVLGFRPDRPVRR